MIHTYAQPYMAEAAGRRYPLADNSEGLDDGFILDFRAVVCDADDAYAAVTEVTAGLITLDVCGEEIAIGLSGHGVQSAMHHTDTTTVAITVNMDKLGSFKGRVPFSRSTIVASSMKLLSLTSVGGVIAQDRIEDMDIYILPGYNTEPYASGQRLLVDVAAGLGMGKYCQVDAGTGQTCGNVMFSINGALPSKDGDISISGGAGISVTPQHADHAIEIAVDSKMSSVLDEYSCY